MRAFKKEPSREKTRIKVFFDIITPQFDETSVLPVEVFFSLSTARRDQCFFLFFI